MNPESMALGYWNIFSALPKRTNSLPSLIIVITPSPNDLCCTFTPGL